MRDETGLATSGSIATAWGVEPGQGSDAHRDISTTADRVEYQVDPVWIVFDE